jgi:hypothetical protein
MTILWKIRGVQFYVDSWQRLLETPAGDQPDFGDIVAASNRATFKMVNDEELRKADKQIVFE